MGLLDQIHTPVDLRRLEMEQLSALAEELRRTILESTARNGGHLASALGAVELTVAMHYVFRTPEDKLIWDVGHQAYAHKLLTGRREAFKRLRQVDGCAPFPTPAESIYDAYIAGHAGTAISAALGFAVADPDHLALAVLGDGALSCGVSLEALNNIGKQSNMIVVLNDNRMSISPNVGALRGYFNRMISARSYNRTKMCLKKLLAHVPGHRRILKVIQKSEETLKSLLLPSGFFEAMGLRYYGPINGHSISELVRTFENVAALHKPAVIHVVTAKGHGCAFAEENPELFHGIAPFDPETGHIAEGGKGRTFSSTFGETLTHMAEDDKRIVAVTAAMKNGTGLGVFEKRFPDRFFDVGIAEEHAVTFAAGLAAGGKHPVVALYSTFLQRALDGVFHDVCLQKLPVLFAIDRAGAVEDGPTHHGIYDLTFLRAMPHLEILNPADPEELVSMLHYAHSLDHPVALRYPRGAGHPRLAGRTVPPIERGKSQWIREGRHGAIFALGAECGTALEVAEILSGEGLDIGVCNVRFMKPFDRETLISAAERMAVFTLEDHVLTGGLASAASECRCANLRGCFGWPDRIIPHGSDAARREKYDLTPQAIADKIKELLR